MSESHSKYPFSQEEHDKVNNNFRYHTPKDNQPQRYEAIRDDPLTLPAQP